MPQVGHPGGGTAPAVPVPVTAGPRPPDGGGGGGGDPTGGAGSAGVIEVGLFSTFLAWARGLLGFVGIGTATSGAGLVGLLFPGSAGGAEERHVIEGSAAEIRIRSDMTTGEVWVDGQPTGIEVTAIGYENGRPTGFQPTTAEDAAALGSIPGVSIEHDGTVSTSSILSEGVENETTETEQTPEVTFGRNANQEYHTWRHVDEAGLPRDQVQTEIKNDLGENASSLSPGLNMRQVEVEGTTIDYNAYVLPDGSVNVGRVTVGEER